MAVCLLIPKRSKHFMNKYLLIPYSLTLSNPVIVSSQKISHESLWLANWNKWPAALEKWLNDIWYNVGLFLQFYFVVFHSVSFLAMSIVYSLIRTLILFTWCWHKFHRSYNQVLVSCIVLHLTIMNNDNHSERMTTNYIIIWCVFLLFVGREPTTWPANNCLLHNLFSNK